MYTCMAVSCPAWTILTAADFHFAGMIFVWALLLGIINVENKLYVFMIIWLVLTYMVASVTAVRFVVLIMAWALLATILLQLLHGMCRLAGRTRVAAAA
jgi:hypothetical protein